MEEQKRIASVLNQAKKEIGLLESELAAIKKQKKGLMQQLLTGKVRVNKEEDYQHAL
jgi:type I restriction enzyme S subunit